MLEDRLLDNVIYSEPNHPLFVQQQDGKVFLGLAIPPQSGQNEILDISELLAPEPTTPEEIPPELITKLYPLKQITLPPEKKIPGLVTIVLILIGIIGLIDMLSGLPITKYIHNANPNNKAPDPPQMVKMDKAEIKKQLISTVSEFTNAGFSLISIEIQRDANLKSNVSMADETIAVTNVGRKDKIHFTIHFKEAGLTPEEEALAENKMYRALPGGIVIIGSKNPLLK